MKFKVNYFKTKSGKSPISKYLDDIDNKKERAEVFSVLRGIQEFGFDAIGVDFRQIDRKLWELKIKTHGNQHRIFYVMLTRIEIVLLHAYLKKTPKAPESEIETARQRYKQLLEERE